MRRRLTLALLFCSVLLVIPVPAHSAGGDLLWQDQFDLAGGDDFPSAIAAVRSCFSVPMASPPASCGLRVVRGHKIASTVCQALLAPPG